MQAYLTHDASSGRTAKGKVWGSDEINVEGWKPLKRLPGHESGKLACHSYVLDFSCTELDVTDVAWSPGDRYLASVGLDSQVMVWCGFTLGEFFSSLFNAGDLTRTAQNASEGSISTRALSRASAGTPLVNSLRLVQTTGL
jgi:WD40 repeat protein